MNVERLQRGHNRPKPWEVMTVAQVECEYLARKLGRPFPERPALACEQDPGLECWIPQLCANELVNRSLRAADATAPQAMDDPQRPWAC
jgi:hypothetical protein